MIKDDLSKLYRQSWNTFSNGASHWDYVILTASNSEQGKWFESQLEQRIQSGFLSSDTVFGVVPDPVGERVGNGGAALGAFRFVADHSGKNDFCGLKILVVLSSGDAKRVAQYSSIGKVFSPVPRTLPNGMSSTLFDEIMLSVSGVPDQIEEGVLILSGDVLLVFDSSQFVVEKGFPAALAFKEPAELGTSHGVFMDDERGFIKDVWHKLPIETMHSYGAIDEDNCVNIDTGAVFFPPAVIRDLFSLLCNEDGECTDSTFHRYVNGVVQPSLYVDFFYPLAMSSTFEGYMKEVPEGRMCDELLSARKELWRVLRPYRIKLLKMKPAKFIDFGTTKDVFDLMTSKMVEYSNLGWEKDVNSKVHSAVSSFDSIVDSSSSVDNNCYLEYSIVLNSRVSDRSILSFVEASDTVIPSSVVLNCIRMINGKYVARIYGIDDNPKQMLENNASMFGVSIASFLEKYGLKTTDLWNPGSEHIVWTANLYNECSSMSEAVYSALNLHKLFTGNDGDIKVFLSGKRTSLSASFNSEDGAFLVEWYNKIKDLL